MSSRISERTGRPAGLPRPGHRLRCRLRQSGERSVDSGLATTEGKEIYLFSENDGTIIVGRDLTAHSSLATAALRSRSIRTTGVISIAQYVSLHHPLTTSNDEGIYLNSGVLSATVTVTDGDGDYASQSTDIAGMIRFEDDGPSVTGSDTTLPTLVVDESFLAADGNNPDAGSDQPPAGSTTAHASFTGLFDETFGADGPQGDDATAAMSYALGLTGAVTTVDGVSGVASGVTDTLTGHEVMLNLVGGVIEGTVLDGVTVRTVFTITGASDGTITLQQDRAVVHDKPNDPDEANDPTVLDLADGAAITLTATATDGDGDHASQSADVSGAFQFKDDGPNSVRRDLRGPRQQPDRQRQLRGRPHRSRRVGLEHLRVASRRGADRNSRRLDLWRGSRPV